MNPSSFGRDTTWLHIQVPLLYVGQTTGFPIAFLTGKLFSYLPFGTMAYRLNTYSVFWGAMTVFVMFIFLKNLLKKEYYIAFISAVFFGFFKVFWFQTGRFEVYTLNTFFTVIIILIGYYWTKTKANKFLYLYYFLIGLSFTNHPISLFLAPAFILYPIYTDYREVFKIKKFFIILALIISPNLLYLYIPIRSLQGYGNVTTFSAFINYITGSEYKGQFGFKGWEITGKIFFEYLDMLKGDFTILVAIISMTGLIFLAIKQRKYFILILSLIVLNLIPVLFYEEQATHFYFTTMAVFLCIPFACGLYSIKEGIVFMFNKYLRKPLGRKLNFLKSGNGPESSHQKRKFVIIRYLFLLVFFMAITAFPANIVASNYEAMDRSWDTYVYDYWKELAGKVKPGSVIITNSLTSHVITYIDMFEEKKDIETVRIFNSSNINDVIDENLDKRDVYYVDAYLPDISGYYELEKVAGRFYQEGFEESFFVYRVLEKKVDARITTENEELEIDFGRKADVVFNIKNNSKYGLDISSIELELPETLEFIGINPQSSIDTPPGSSEGIYMWTVGPYSVKPGEQFTVSFVVRAKMKADGYIDFRITTCNMYVHGPSIEVIVN